MISTEEEKVFRVFDLIGQKQRYGFKTLFATVNIVSKEKIVCFRRKTSIFKQTKQITILAMDVSTNLYRGFQLQQVGLAHKHLFGCDTKLPDLLLSKLHLFSRSSVTNV
mmetsp:Transcript_32164/g.76467  ORF Transcript_32164/g.76467 Transcript_32164/m.76467 type:complete len:109 (+) Transcript_32164:891-1217(+)